MPKESSFEDRGSSATLSPQAAHLNSRSALKYEALEAPKEKRKRNIRYLQRLLLVEVVIGRLTHSDCKSRRRLEARRVQDPTADRRV